jgi:hypothetical protein
VARKQVSALQDAGQAIAAEAMPDLVDQTVDNLTAQIKSVGTTVWANRLRRAGTAGLGPVAQLSARVSG